MTRRLVLVGGGLAHLHVLREWRRHPIPDVDVVLVAPSREWIYSGMAPGYLHGAYEAAELSIDLEALARCAGARFVLDSVDRVSARGRTVRCGDEQIEFDFCSIDVGAGAAGLNVPGAESYAVSLRPMSRVFELRARMDALIDGGRPFAVAVVGAGMGGIEVALALHRRVVAGAGHGTVTLVDGGSTILRGETEALRQRVLDLLVARGVGRALGNVVAGVDAFGLTLGSGARVPAELVAWTTGGAPPPLLAASDLPLDADGFLRIDDTLGVVGTPGLWAAGDCAVVAGAEGLPRAGVHAVRQGRVLWQNLCAYFAAGRPTRYRRPRRTLAVLDTADGSALARWGALHLHASMAWWLKQRIDRRFVAGFRDRCDESAALRS